MTDPDDRSRCPWAADGSGPDGTLMLDYHDREWGRPLRGRTAMFERMTLEAFQSGLSWLIILRKRENFRLAFAGFVIVTVAAYTETRNRALGAAPGHAGPQPSGTAPGERVPPPTGSTRTRTARSGPGSRCSSAPRSRLLVAHGRRPRSARIRRPRARWRSRSPKVCWAIFAGINCS